MHKGNCGFCRSVVKVAVKTPHLRCHKHSLVNNGFRAHGAHIEYLAEKLLRLSCDFFYGAAAYIKLALECSSFCHILRPAQKCLLDGWHTIPRRLAQIMRICWHVTPEQERNTALGTAFFKKAKTAVASFFVLWQKEHGYTIITLGR